MTKRKAGDGKPPPRMLLWLTAIRDHPDRPPPIQRHVLTCLMLRMDWETGCGFASTGQLAADADCEDRTVRYATAWARRHRLLHREKQGHRRGDGSVWASEWELRLPSRPVTDDLLATISTGTGMPVEGISTGTRRHLNRHEEASQPARSTAPSIPVPSIPKSSSARASAAGNGAAVNSPVEKDQEMIDDQDFIDKNNHHPGHGQCPDCGGFFRIVGGGRLHDHPGCPNSPGGWPAEPVPCIHCGRTTIGLSDAGLCTSCARRGRVARRYGRYVTADCGVCGQQTQLRGDGLPAAHDNRQTGESCPGGDQPVRYRTAGTA